MADWGIKISQDGYDVKTAPIDKLVLTSKANQWKVHMKGTVTFTSNGSTITVSHGLGYTPAFIVMTKNASDSYYQNGNINNSADSTYLYLVGNNGDVSSYVIFKDFGA
jgi:hypothetical protein